MFWQKYKSLTTQSDCPAEVWVYLACALFFLGLYKEAEEAASKGMLYAPLMLTTTLGHYYYFLDSFGAFNSWR